MEKKYFDLNKLNTTALAFLFLAAAPAQFAYGMDPNNTTENSNNLSPKQKTQTIQEENCTSDVSTLPQVTQNNTELPKLEYVNEDKQVVSSKSSEKKKENSSLTEENKKDLTEPKKKDIESSEILKNTEQKNTNPIKNIILNEDNKVKEISQKEKSKKVKELFYNFFKDDFKVDEKFISENFKVDEKFISENLFNKNKYVGKNAKEKCESKALHGCIQILSKEHEKTPYRYNFNFESIKHFVEKYKENDPFIIYMLGYCYQTGTGTNQNSEEAMAQYHEATQLGFLLVGESYEFVKKQLELKNKKNALSCINSMGHTYADLGEMDEAIKCFQIASSKGSFAATYNLGYCYENGKGVEKSIETAKKYYQEASNKGYQKATQAIKRLGL
jgi:hypothetical protein